MKSTSTPWWICASGPACEPGGLRPELHLCGSTGGTSNRSNLRCFRNRWKRWNLSMYPATHSIGNFHDIHWGSACSTPRWLMVYPMIQAFNHPVADAGWLFHAKWGMGFVHKNADGMVFLENWLHHGKLWFISDNGDLWWTYWWLSHQHLGFSIFSPQKAWLM